MYSIINILFCGVLILFIRNNTIYKFNYYNIACRYNLQITHDSHDDILRNILQKFKDKLEEQQIEQLVRAILTNFILFTPNVYHHFFKEQLKQLNLNTKPLTFKNYK